MGVLKQSAPDEIKYQGKILEIVGRPMSDGVKEVTFEIARRAPGVRLIIVDTEKKQVLLTKEHRYELNGFDYRLPGGKVVDTLEEFHAALEAGNIAQLAEIKAKAEGKEEAGMFINTVSPYHISVVGSTVEWDLHYFVVEDFTQDQQELEHGEEISVDWYSFDEAKAMCLDGRVSEERSALVLLRYLNTISTN